MEKLIKNPATFSKAPDRLMLWNQYIFFQVQNTVISRISTNELPAPLLLLIGRLTSVYPITVHVHRFWKIWEDQRSRKMTPKHHHHLPWSMEFILHWELKEIIFAPFQLFPATPVCWPFVTALWDKHHRHSVPSLHFSSVHLVELIN